MGSTPSSPMVPHCDPTPGSPSQTQTRTRASFSTLSPPSPSQPSSNGGTNISVSPGEEGDGSIELNDSDEQAAVKLVKVEFYDSRGLKVEQSRYCDDDDIIDIMESMIRFKESKHKNAFVSKVCKSVHFKHLIQKRVLETLSQMFTDYLKSETCDLKVKNKADCEELSKVDWTEIYYGCLNSEREVFSAMSLLVLGKSLEAVSEERHLKQRLTAVIGIAAVSRNQKINLIQRMLGKFDYF